MKPYVTLITLGVDDLERALRFYRDGLGLPTRGIVGTEIEHGAVVFIDLQSGLKLALWPRKDLAWDAGVPQSPSSATEMSLGHNVNSSAGGRRHHGAGGAGRSADRQAGAPDILGRLCGVLSGPRRAS